MVRPFAVLLAVFLVAAGCGGGTADDGSGSRAPAVDTDVPTEQPAPSPLEDGGEPAAPELPSDSAPVGPADDPLEQAGAADPGERPEQGEQAAGETEPAGEPPTATDSGEPESGGESSDESPAAADTVATTEPTGEPGTATDAAGQEGGDAATDGPGTPAEAPEPAAVAEPTPADGGTDAGGDVAFADCGQVYLCAMPTVPLDHDDPDGATVDLAVGMIPAADPARRIGYLLVNPGGPGGGMHEFLNAGAGLSTNLLDRFDVIGWDPRGVGGSVPSGCWGEARDLYLLDPIPDSPDEQDALDAAARTLAEACAARLGDAVGHIGTIDTVRDMDAIRRALGAETISYLGFSYGTLLGVHYAGMFGEHLRAAVLDGVIDPSLTGVETAVGQTVGFARTIDEMFAWCRTEPTCPVTGDPTETYDLLLEQLDVAPSVDFAGTVVLDPARAILAAVVASYSSDFWPFFFDALAAAVDGDGTMFGLLGEAYIGIADLGAFISINCTDRGAATRQELDAVAQALADAAGDFGWSAAVPGLPCEYWPVAAGTLPTGAVAAPDAPPILVVGNRGDNATPYEWAVSVADQLHSGVLVSYDGTEHTSYGLSTCVDRVVDDYLIDGVVPPGDVDCPAEGERRRGLPGGGVAAPATAPAPATVLGGRDVTARSGDRNRRPKSERVPRPAGRSAPRCSGGRTRTPNDGTRTRCVAYYTTPEGSSNVTGYGIDHRQPRPGDSSFRRRPESISRRIRLRLRGSARCLLLPGGLGRCAGGAAPRGGPAVPSTRRVVGPPCVP